MVNLKFRLEAAKHLNRYNKDLNKKVKHIRKILILIIAKK